MPQSDERFCRRRLLAVHAIWLAWSAVWGLALIEVRTSALGGCLLIAGLASVALVAVDEFLLRTMPGRGRAGRVPRFTLHVWAGIVAIACGSFGLMSCFLMDLPNEALLSLPRHAPLSRWVFVTGGVFGLTVLYGAVVVALGSGLLGALPSQDGVGSVAS